ncbi:MAG: PIN domain-containing protein [Cyanobacteriota bacterium]
MLGNASTARNAPASGTAGSNSRISWFRGGPSAARPPACHLTWRESLRQLQRGSLESGFAPRAQPGLSVRVFVDANLWAYRLDRREPHKGPFIKTWLRQLAQDHEIVISAQVLIELRAVMTRTLQPALSAADCLQALEALAQFDVVPTDAALVLDAHELAAANQLSWFDALILEAAIRHGCTVLYSEDFSSGQQFGGLVVVNPFEVA